MGVAGASLPQATVLLTGVAGLLAGAISMALGEWLSVQSARELYARQVAIEREELETAPTEELEELALIYQAKGIPADRAQELAETLIANPQTALDTLVREELGIDPEGSGRLGVGGGGHLVRAVCRGRARSPAAVLLHRRPDQPP